MTWELTTSAGSFRLSAIILECPADGAWWADATIAGDTVPDSAVTLVLGDTSWTGTIQASSLDGGRVHLRIVGGAGGLGTTVQDRYEQSPTTAVDSIASGLCSIGGETLGDCPTTKLGSWQRLRGTVGSALDDLARTLGLRWRVNAAGKVILAEQANPDHDKPGQLLEQSTERAIYGVASFDLDGPCTVDSFVANHVTHHLSEKGIAKTILHTNSPRLALRALNDSRPHGRVFRGTVDSQTGETVTVTIGTPSSGGTGPSGSGVATGSVWSLRNIPLWPGLPGATMTLAPNAGVLVLFIDDDPRKAIAMPAPYGQDPLELSLNATNRLNLGANAQHTVARGDAVVAWFRAIQTAQCAAPGSPLVITPPINPQFPEFADPSGCESTGPARVP